MTKRMRIRATDEHGNVAYVHERNGVWKCVLSNGTPASLSYAGIGRDEIECEFALEDCSNIFQALTVMRERGGKNWTYEEVRA